MTTLILILLSITLFPVLLIVVAFILCVKMHRGYEQDQIF